MPQALLDRVKKMERSCCRRLARGWGARVLDLDIVRGSDGAGPDQLRERAARGLAVPHRSIAERDFVLAPAAEIAADWRHPISGLRVRHLLSRLRPSNIDPGVRAA